MSDYLQRLVSRHFGHGAPVMPNANRYFSRGTELAADAAPDAVAEPAETLAAESPAEGTPVARPAAEDAEHRAAPHARTPAESEEQMVPEPPSADTETIGAMPVHAPRPWHTPRAPERELPETPESPSRRAPGARHGTNVPRIMLNPVGDSSARKGGEARAPSTKPFATFPSSIGQPQHAVAAPTEKPATALRSEASVRAAKASANSRSGVTRPQPAAFAPADGAAATLATETVMVQFGETAPGQRASRPPTMPNRSALQVRRTEAAAVDRRGSPSRHRAATAAVDATDARVSLARDPAPSAAPGGPLAPAREGDNPLPVVAGIGLRHAAIEPMQSLSPASGTAPAAPEITVTIGSVELHAAPAAPPPPAVVPERRGPRLSLDEYLQRRSKGRP